jgi:hypothetical protein
MAATLAVSDPVLCIFIRHVSTRKTIHRHSYLCWDFFREKTFTCYLTTWPLMTCIPLSTWSGAQIKFPLARSDKPRSDCSGASSRIVIHQKGRETIDQDWLRMYQMRDCLSTRRRITFSVAAGFSDGWRSLGEYMSHRSIESAADMSPVCVHVPR